MAPSTQSLASAAGLLALVPSALAGFSATGIDNVSVYWGQNSAKGADTQQRLSTYCTDNGINIINLAFMDAINNPTINFASSENNCTPVEGTGLAICPDIEADIEFCQSQGKTIILSLAGSTYTEGGFSDATAAQQAAANVWSLFGSDTSAPNRPFGSAVVDGFDFDLESSNTNFAPFAQELRDLMDADTSKTFYMSAAPQCMFPDVADNDMLDGAVSFDWINVQFYNNNCGVINFSNSNAWNFDTWDNWAKTTSKNPNVRVLIGVLATSTAGGGFVDVSAVETIIAATASEFSSFGGMMIWDMSQLFTNAGFLDGINSALAAAGGSSPAAPTTTAAAATTTTATPTTLSTMTTTATATTGSGSGLAQWAQCGGEGYTGPTACAPPFACQSVTPFWSQCD